MTTRASSFSLAASVFLVAAAVAAPHGWAFASAPVIVFESESCDLGSVVQGEQPDCVFSFSNGGSGDLRILHVEPSCGCTTALITAALTRAGERGGIRVVFDSENFAGEIVKEVEVLSNDPVRPSITLQVKALVEPEIDFEPRLVTFDDVRSGSALRQVVMLTNRRADPVRILRLSAEPASYRCILPGWDERSLPLQLEPWDRVVLEVRFAPQNPLAMPIAGECAFEIEGPRRRHFRLKLLALPAP